MLVGGSAEPGRERGKLSTTATASATPPVSRTPRYRFLGFVVFILYRQQRSEKCSKPNEECSYAGQEALDCYRDALPASADAFCSPSLLLYLKAHPCPIWNVLEPFKNGSERGILIGYVPHGDVFDSILAA